MVSFLSAATGIATIALTALAMNCRHMFYGVTFLKEFKSMGKRYPYMIFSLTDETYALYCSLSIRRIWTGIRLCLTLRGSAGHTG
ncbi:MAG: AzlC family ABC transporter permease [Clostridium sp.]